MRVRLIHFVLFVAVLSVLPGCGNPNQFNPSGKQKSLNVPCKMVFSGAFSATAPCNLLCVDTVSSVPGHPTNMSVITIGLAGTSPDFSTAVLNLTISGAPVFGTLTNGSFSSYSAAATKTINGSPTTWIASQQQNSGTVSVTINSVQQEQSQSSPSGSVSFYSIHGTAQAVLAAPPQTSSSSAQATTGIVTMAVTF